MFDFPNSPVVGSLVTGTNGATYRWDGTKWVTAGPPTTTVTSFNTRTGPVLLTQGDVNLALGYTAYNATNPSSYIGDAPNDGNAYVRRNLAWLNGDTRFMQQSAADTRYLQLSGAAPMTGLLTLSGAPTANLHAATKAYVDAKPYVATTTGNVSVTGTTTETNLAALRIPANALGANGAAELKCIWSYTNSSNNKTMLVRFTNAAGSAAGGVAGSNLVVTTFQTSQTMWLMRNNNATNAQAFFTATGVAPFGHSAAAPITTAIDTTADTYVNVNGQLALGTETLTLVHAYLVVFPHA